MFMFSFNQYPLNENIKGLVLVYSSKIPLDSGEMPREALFHARTAGA
jgi:hypothetical protein